MNIIKKALLPIISLFAFASCEVEFSPNAEWTETPVVYCLIDQDDDTTFVRVQRCFLGTDNNYQYAAIADSINYRQGDITVIMEEWNGTQGSDGLMVRTGDAPRRIFNFDYQEIVNKDSGVFYNTVQPVYACPTAGQLDTSCVYRLRVIKNATGDTIAQAETSLIYGQMRLSKPNNVTMFQFAGTSGSKTCEITWSALKGARQYQPVIRFFYRDFIVDQTVLPWDTTITPHYLDIPCNVVKSNMRDPYFTTFLEQNYFFTTIKNALKDSVCNRNAIDTVLVFINCCTEDLAAYIYASHPAGTFSSQEPFNYTNIEGGIGVFAARRRNISFTVNTPVSSASNYIKSLKALNVGF